MAETVHHKVMIIGSGPAGYTAAVYAARAMLEPGIVAGLQPGGQLTITTDVENYPGFPEILGPELMDKFKEHALKFGTDFYEDVILDVDFTKRPFTLKSDSGTNYTADSVIIATGAQAKWLGLDSESKFQGFGVSPLNLHTGPHRSEGTHGRGRHARERVQLSHRGMPLREHWRLRPLAPPGHSEEHASRQHRAELRRWRRAHDRLSPLLYG